MCKFLSLKSSQGKVWFLNAQQREELRINNPNKYNFDSHSSISDYYNLDGDKTNSWEVNIFPKLKLVCDMLNTKDDTKSVQYYVENHLIEDFGGMEEILKQQFIIKDGILIKFHYIGLTKITIPDNVASIGYGAFDGCTRLTEITIPNSVISISDYAFGDCTGLTEIIIPNSVTSIDDYVFRGCTKLTEITIPNSVTSIANCAFRGCTKIIKNK